MIKNPDKMSERELRLEVKERRARTDEFYKAAYDDGYADGWNQAMKTMAEYEDEDKWLDLG